MGMSKSNSNALVAKVWRKLTTEDIHAIVHPLLEYYPVRDRGIIADRVAACILLRQKAM